MSEPVFLFDGQDPEMKQACLAAQSSFRYFWRELSWERRRIVPALDLAMVKLPFTEGPRTDDKPEYEHMWVEDIGFDGDTLTGTLLNTPNWLISVSVGAAISMPLSHLSDWMLTAEGRAYGGFTVNLMRSRMKPKARSQHDKAWRLDFGDPADVKVELFAKKKKSSKTKTDFADHPMCLNMLPDIEAELENDRSIANSVFEDGWTLLHQEAMAGNLGIVKLLIAYGADVSALTPNGYTASQVARKIGWSEIAKYVEEHEKKAE